MAADPKYATTTATTTVTAASRPIQPLHTTQPIHHDPSSLLYPVSSSGRGFIPKPIDPSSSHLLAYSRGVPPPHFDYLNHYPHLPIKPLPLSPHPIPKVCLCFCHFLLLPIFNYVKSEFLGKGGTHWGALKSRIHNSCTTNLTGLYCFLITRYGPSSEKDTIFIEWNLSTLQPITRFFLFSFFFWVLSLQI